MCGKRSAFRLVGKHPQRALQSTYGKEHEMSGTIDLRSDTVTRPTEAMRQAMHTAEVGDDYYDGGDPTVRRLEERAAEMFRKQAGMLVLSGTMGNIVSILTHTRPGDSVIVEERSHIYNNESGQLSVLGGLTTRTVRGDRGKIPPSSLREVAFPDSILHPPTRLLCLENTHNAAGGSCLNSTQTRELAIAAHALKIAVHLDGARIFNASIALGEPVHQLAEHVGSLTFCLTKGLSCPVGSLVLGSREFIAEARRWRQVIGGGMRQAGCFAAAGLVGLDSMVERLADDHENARRLAEGLANVGLAVESDAIETNMVFVNIAGNALNAGGFVEALRRLGILVNPPKGGRIRFVTHYGITRVEVDRAIAAASEVIQTAPTPKRENAAH
jgi:threonine aldolase